MERPVPEWSGLPCEWIHSSACPSSGAIFRTVDPHVVASVEATAGSITSFGASLRITLNPIETAGVYTFNVVLTNDRSATTTVSPLSSWGLAITSGGQSASSTTKPTGEVDFTIQKTESTIPGGGNRTVTYSFSGRITSNPVYPSESWVGRWSTKDLTFIDAIPAGATVTFSTGAGGAAWTHVDNLDGSQTWSLVIPGPFAAGGSSTCTPTLTVYYPAPTFSDGTRPPTNVVQISAVDKSVGPWGPESASVRGSVMTGGSGPDMWLGLEEAYTSTGSHRASSYANTYRIRGVVHDTNEVPVGARNFVLTDDTTTAPAFWEHAALYRLDVQFSSVMAEAEAPWQLQFTYDGPSAPAGWQTVYSGTTAAGRNLYFAVDGANESIATGALLVRRDPGLTITGWRLVVSPDDDPVLHGAMATVVMQFRPMWRSTLDGEPLGWPTETVNVTNVSLLTADNAETGEPIALETASHTLGIRDGIAAQVSASMPSTLMVGAPDKKVRSGISVGYDLPASACVATVLPPGVRWSGAPVQLVTSQVPAGSGAPLEIGTTTLESTPDGRDIVIVCFDKPFPPNFGSHASYHGWPSRVTFDIPVVTLPSAYAPPTSNTAQALAYAIVEDPAAVQSVDTSQYIVNDVFDLDPSRDRVGGDNASTSILDQGGLQLEKQVSVASAAVNGSTFTGLASNSARVGVLAAPALSLEKRTNGVAYDAAPGAVVATGSAVTWT